MSDEIKIPDDLAKQLFDRGDCSLDAAKIIARWMREECAKVADEKVSYSSMPNPSELDRGWKRCAKVIAKDIRAVGT